MRLKWRTWYQIKPPNLIIKRSSSSTVFVNTRWSPSWSTWQHHHIILWTMNLAEHPILSNHHPTQIQYEWIHGGVARVAWGERRPRLRTWWGGEGQVIDVCHHFAVACLEDKQLNTYFTKPVFCNNSLLYKTHFFFDFFYQNWGKILTCNCNL